MAARRSACRRGHTGGPPAMTPFIARGQALATVAREQNGALDVGLPRPSVHRSLGKGHVHLSAGTKPVATQEVLVYYSPSHRTSISTHTGSPRPPKGSLPARSPKAAAPCAADNKASMVSPRKAPKAGNGNSTAMNEPSDRRLPSPDISFYIRDAEAGVSGACFQVAKCYHHGQCGAEKDPARAIAWFRKGGKRGEVESLHALGQLYHTGELEAYGLPLNQSKANKYFRLASSAAVAAATPHTTLTVEAGSMPAQLAEGNNDSDRDCPSSSFSTIASSAHSLTSAGLSVCSGTTDAPSSRQLSKPSLRRRLSFGTKGLIAAAKNAFRGPRRLPSQSVPNSPVVAKAACHSQRPPRPRGGAIRRALSFPRLSWGGRQKHEPSEAETYSESAGSVRDSVDETEHMEASVVHLAPNDGKSQAGLEDRQPMSPEEPDTALSIRDHKEEAIERLSRDVSNYQEQLKWLKQQVRELGAEQQLESAPAHYGNATQNTSGWRYLYV